MVGHPVLDRGLGARAVSTTALLWVNRISGGALVIFGIAAIASVLT